MPNLVNLTVNNGESTPVAQVFKPDYIDPKTGVAHLYVPGASSAKGNMKLTLSRRLSGGKYRIRVKLEMPTVVTETINGVSVDKVAYVAFADTQLTFDEGSTEAERKDVIALMANTLSHSDTLVTGVLVDLEGIY